MPETSVAEKLKNVDLTGDAMTAADNVLKTLGMKPKASAVQKEQARKARKGASIAANGKRKVTTPKAFAPERTSAPTELTTADRSQLVGGGGVAFRAADYMSGDIWVPDERIPAIDEATYETYKTRAQGQARSIEVASLNLKNIDGLHKLEGQTIDIAVTAKNNETKYAKLEGAEIDYQTQVQVNGEKSQRLYQATDSYQAATRETDYHRQLIGMKDDNYQLEIQQAQSMFTEKSARYRAQLADGQ